MNLAKKLITISSVALLLAGCSNFGLRTAKAPEGSVATKPPAKSGGYYKDDGPGSNPPANLEDVPDAVPLAEPLHRYANNPYKVMGKEYVPLPPGQAYKEKGLASWYGRRFHGKPTSSGEPYDMYAMTAAHPTLPIPSYVRVSNPANGRSVVVRVNDRGPFHEDRLIDLSYTAALKLDLLKGVTQVEVEKLDPATYGAAAPTRPNAEPVRVASNAPVSLPETPDRYTEAPSRPLAAQDTGAGTAPPVASRQYLQLGSFISIAKASELTARIERKLGYALPVVFRLEEDGTITVLAGPYPDNAEAERMAGLLQRELDIQARGLGGGSLPSSAPANNSAPATIAETTLAPASAGEMPSISTANPVTPPARLQSGHYLQLAALSSVEAAEGFMRRVKEARIGNIPGLHRIESNGLYKIQAGPYGSAPQASEAAQAFEREMGIRPYRLSR